MSNDFFDAEAMRQAMSGPGNDTRQWVSYGRVSPDTPSGASVRFDVKDEQGTQIGQPLVVVKLEPSGIEVPCRVSSMTAGQGEGEWYPFVAGDEVLVVIPEGNERAGCCIIGRLNQSLDTFPTTVGGQDVTKNNFGFRRARAPYVFETAESYMVRGASTGWQLTFDRTGNLFLASSDKHHLILNHDGVMFGLGDDSCSIQMHPEHGMTLSAGAGAATLALKDGVSTFFTTGGLSLSTLGIGATGHGIAMEQVAALLANLLTVIGAPVLLATPQLIDAGVAGIIDTTSKKPLDPTMFPLTLAAIRGALAQPADPTGVIPGFGKGGLLI